MHECRVAWFFDSQYILFYGICSNSWDTSGNIKFVEAGVLKEVGMHKQVNILALDVPHQPLLKRIRKIY